MISVNKLASRSFIFCMSIVVLFLVWDFTARVWSPIDTEEPDATDTFDPQQVLADTDYDLPPYLSAWLNSVAPEPDEGASEDTDANTREALPGSNEFGTFRLRIRGVFSSTNEQGESRAMAIAERQDVESGEVTRLTLTLQEQLSSDYHVSQISSASVTIRRAGQNEEVTLLVFDPVSRAQQSEEINAEEINTEEGLLIPQPDNDVAVEESATTQELGEIEAALLESDDEEDIEAVRRALEAALEAESENNN